MLNHAAKAYRTNYAKPLPTVICVDEVLYAKHHYGFEMINGMKSDLIEILPTRTSIDIRRYLSTMVYLIVNIHYNEQLIINIVVYINY